MENKMEINVACKDESIKAKYEELSAKMLEDSKFKKSLYQCKTRQEIYDLYKKNDYTDLEYEAFCEQLNKMLKEIVPIQNYNCELTDEDLEYVVGGGDFDFFRVFTSTISILPVAGPAIAGIAKAINAGVNGGTFSDVVLNLAVGTGCALFDAVAYISTMGAAAPVSYGIKLALGLGKASLNEAL